MSQLTLPIIQTPDYSFDNFVTNQNQNVSAYLKQTASSLSQKSQNTEIAYIHSKEAIGKTHLLHACCRFSELNGLQSVFLDGNYLVEMPTEILTGIDEYHVICIDNFSAIALKEEWQVVFFDLINKLRENADRFVVFAANKKPDSLGIALPDLVSRLNWGTRFKLKPYDDDDKVEILISQAKGRGLHMPTNCARYILNTCSRDLHQLLNLIERIDESSWKEKRSITIPFLKKILSQSLTP